MVRFHILQVVARVAMAIFLAFATTLLPLPDVSVASSDPTTDPSKSIHHRKSFWYNQTEIEWHTGWTACHASAVIHAAYGCTLKNRRRTNVTLPFVVMNITTLPTTAMAVLIDNQQIHAANFNNITMKNIYNSQNLGLIPDIHKTGRDFYTLLYQIEIPLNHSDVDQKVYVKFAGINYRATVWYNGVQLPNLQYQYFNTTTPSFIPPNIPGMFLRHRYDITPTPSQSNGVNRTNLLVVMIEPPFHPGYPVSGQQGGSHDLAQDGAVPQYMLGWDWCTSMPDRATGFYGAVTLKYTQRNQSSLLQSSSNVLFHSNRDNEWLGSIHDPAIQTVDMRDCSWTDNDTQSLYICSYITLRLLVHLEWSNAPGQERLWKISDASPNITLSIESDWGGVWSVSCFDCGESDGYVDLQQNMTVEDATSVRLWWPHGVGISNYAHMHNFTIRLLVNDKVTDIMTIPVGIRTIETYLDHDMEGQRFRVNHHDIYLIGGNWIGTDQALRYSASKQRYCDEILLHQYAGLNTIRVWGGSTAERDQFYECADQYGMLVYQEFWMTGDNNGRWAGNYSWPRDYTAYLVNVEDNVKRLRRHASLLFYAGCNECLSMRESPWAPNPPLLLDDGIRRIFEKFDPGRFYISSSMGGVRICI